MAELDFLLNREEQKKLVEFLLEDRAILIPSLWYKKPEYQRLTSSEEVVDIRSKMSGPIFVLWQDIAKYPIEFSEIDKEEGKFFFLSQKHGGPYLDYLPCHELPQSDGSIDLVNGFIAYYKEYIVNKELKTIQTPDSIKQKYRMISKFIRSICQRTQVKNFKRYYWVGHEALEMFRNGVFADSLDLDI